MDLEYYDKDANIKKRKLPPTCLFFQNNYTLCIFFIIIFSLIYMPFFQNFLYIYVIPAFSGNN